LIGKELFVVSEEYAASAFIVLYKEGAGWKKGASIHSTVFHVHVPCILNNGNFVQLDDTVLFDTFTHTLHVSGIYHPSSGAILQIGAVGITTCGSVLCPVGCLSVCLSVTLG
jgi:hypothetical protein